MQLIKLWSRTSRQLRVWRVATVHVTILVQASFRCLVALYHHVQPEATFFDHEKSSIAFSILAICVI